MRYHLVYDVANDGPPWLGVAFAVLVLLPAVACLLEIINCVRGGRRSPVTGRPQVAPLAGAIILLLVVGCIEVFLASHTYDAYVQQRRCREWVRAGQYQVTEGTVADYQFRKAGSRFRVADESFDLLEVSAGFTGRFNAPGAAEGSLRDGLPVRLAHREGFVLRVEIAP